MDNFPENTLLLPDLKELGRCVKARRKEDKLSQKDLATMVGCGHVAISQLEKGNGNLNLSTAWRILEVLGLTGKASG